MSRQISYFIEGGDNVGKTTLIDHITQNFTEDYKKEFTKSIGFFINKYPTKDNTEFMNVINKVLRFCNDWKTLISKDEKYHDLYSRVNNLLINTMIKDMDKSLIDTVPRGKKNSWNYINISDRGPLSTYLYNYKDTDNTMNEIYNFEKFVKEYIISKFDSMKQMLDLMKQIDEYMSNLNIVILNNNLPDIPIISDKQEEIEYKKNFDDNSELQQKINCQISNIITAIDNKKDIDTITYPFKLHYINIYHDNGVRKTTEEVYEEFKKLIFNTIKEENNNE
jgi:thymidylate kinase|nr:MAG TPA: P-loop Nucleotide Kinase3 [Caudoviricetes sp.]